MRDAARAALKLRHMNGISLQVPLSVIDFASDKLGIEVRFLDAPSLEGFYVRREVPVIVIGADRPYGRQAMTCAHEIGHHVFGHANCWDAIAGSQETGGVRREEFIATTFGGFLMMPRPLVLRGFTTRGLDCTSCAPEDVLVVSGWIGVGYSTLVEHMRSSLSLISDARAACLLRMAPNQLRRSLAARFAQVDSCTVANSDLYVLDDAWLDRSLDLRVGDVVVLKTRQEFEGACCVSSGEILTATSPGIGRLVKPTDSFALFVRVRRRVFEGLAEFRHLEEVK